MLFIQIMIASLLIINANLIIMFYSNMYILYIYILWTFTTYIHIKLLSCEIKVSCLKVVYIGIRFASQFIRLLTLMFKMLGCDVRYTTILIIWMLYIILDSNLLIRQETFVVNTYIGQFCPLCFFLSIF